MRSLDKMFVETDLSLFFGENGYAFYSRISQYYSRISKKNYRQLVSSQRVGQEGNTLEVSKILFGDSLVVDRADSYNDCAGHRVWYDDAQEAA